MTKVQFGRPIGSTVGVFVAVLIASSTTIAADNLNADDEARKKAAWWVLAARVCDDAEGSSDLLEGAVKYAVQVSGKHPDAKAAPDYSEIARKIRKEPIAKDVVQSLGKLSDCQSLRDELKSLGHL